MVSTSVNDKPAAANLEGGDGGGQEEEPIWEQTMIEEDNRFRRRRSWTSSCSKPTGSSKFGRKVSRTSSRSRLTINSFGGGGGGGREKAVENNNQNQQQQQPVQTYWDFVGPGGGGGGGEGERQLLQSHQEQQQQEDICSVSGSPALVAAAALRKRAFLRSREAMNPALWSTLPDHLLDSILARLPIQSFFRFRTVCKSWNTHMYRGSFLEAYAGIPSQGPWFFFFTHDERNHVSTYNSALNKWHKLPLCPPHSNTNPFSAADGGLVCYFSYENGSKSIVVCNPLTKSCRRLPPLLKTPSKVTLLAMVVDRVTKAYKVVVAGLARLDYGGFQNRAEVYDSQTEIWTTTGGNIPASHTLKGKPIFSQGFLYVRSQTQQRNLLLAYDLDQGVWSDLQAPLPATVRHGELLEWQGQILMVGELEEDHKVQSICIWEQMVGGLKWKEVDRLPAGLFEGFFGNKDYFQCNERDDVILDWCQAGRFVLLFAYNLYDVRGRCKLLVYDLSKRSWQKMQNFSRADVCGTGRIIRGIFHEPRLDAKA